MKILNLIQGSKEWHEQRAKCFTASEAPAMMGASKYQSRDALLKLKATGIAPEIDDFKQAIFNKGHEAEAKARPFVEALIGEDLYPVTGFAEVEGLPLLASFDGLTAGDNVGFEHKLWNESLAKSVREHNLDLHYVWQLEQQLLVSGAEKITFVVSDGTESNFVYLDYFGSPEMREKLIAGWKQFAIDLADYAVPEADAPKAIAAPVDTLPAINYKIDFSNGVSLTSNLSFFKEAALKLVERSKEQLKTDQDFEDAKARIKAYKTAEENCENLISRVMGEMGDVDAFAKDLTEIKGFIAKARLAEDKQIKTRNEEIKAEIIAEAKRIVSEHVAALNAKLSPLHVPAFSADFAAAIKGKSSFDNMRSAVSSMIANAKIESNKLASDIEMNREQVRMIAPKMDFLFADLQQLCEKETDYVRAIAEKRVADHQKSEQERIQSEAKKLADEQLEKERKEAEAKTQTEVSQPVTALASVPADYEQFAAQAPSFEESFQKVFVEDSEQEAFVDMSDFHAGFNACLKKVETAYAECLRNGTDFKVALECLKMANKLPAKAA